MAITVSVIAVITAKIISWTLVSLSIIRAAPTAPCPGGIWNGSAACPDRLASSPVKKSGGLRISLMCIMFGSSA